MTIMEQQPLNSSTTQERAHHLFARYSQLRSQFLHEQHVSEEAARFSLGQAHNDYVVLAGQLAAGVAYFDRLIQELQLEHEATRRS
jgi:hypothetical protein